MSSFFFSFLFFSLSGLGLTVAQVELPADLADNSERIQVSGFGGHNRGKFQLAEFHGKFARGESRLSLMNSTYVSSKGSSSFVLLDADSAEQVSAECQVRKKTVNVDVITFDPKKMAYQCDFWQDEKLLGARLVVGQPKAKGLTAKIVAMDRRSGESNLFDNYFVIESLHKYKGSKFQSPSPAGYILRRDSQTIAAVELTDVNPTMFIANGIDADLRRSAIASALALMVLRDPANSALED